MRARERLSCAVGHVFIDLYTQLLYSFQILFFMKVLQLSASQAGLIVLIGELSDAAMSLIAGYLGDNVNVPFLSSKIGKRKSWHLLATFLMAIGVPLSFNKCFVCDGRDQSWLPLVYFGFFSALVKICYSTVAINHLAFIINVAEKVLEFTTLVAVRTMFSFLSGVYVYVIAWALLGQDKGDSLGPTHLSDFAYLSWIATGTGVFFANIFYIGTKEPRKTRERKPSLYVDMNVGGSFIEAFKEENQNSRKTSLVHSIADMVVPTSLRNKNPDQEDEGHVCHCENRQRNTSFVKKFVEVLFYNEGDEIDQSSSQTDPQGDASKQMVLGLQKLDKCRQRRYGVVASTGIGQLGVPNFGFEDEKSEKKEEECSSDTSGHGAQKDSVSFSSSELPVLRSMNGDGGEELELDAHASVEKPPTVENKSQEGDKETESVGDGCNPSALEDKQEVLGFPVSSTIHPAKKRRPKTLKHWLRDPNLYKIAIIFTCASLARNTVYTYLPLFLTERLQFAKEAIAYFPLVLMISASFSTMFCGKLSERIGTKWSYPLAASIVVGGAVWSYFQTPSTRQVTYAPVIMMGFGMSVMFVMSTAFITELIGDNKDTSGLVISIIVVINRVSSGAIVMSIQSLYPERDSNSNEVISSFVQHVFVVAPGILGLVGSVVVLTLQQPSVLVCNTKALKENTEIQADGDKPLPNEVTLQISSNHTMHTATPSVSQDVNQNTTMAFVLPCSLDTKL